MRSWTFTTHDEAETSRLAECVAAALDGLDGSTVIAIEGELGAGKTRFVRGLAAGLGIDPHAITSPTFVLSIEHAGAFGMRLAHLDAWRLRSSDELASVGWEEMLARSQMVIAVEWASRIEAALPAERITVRIEHGADSEDETHSGPEESVDATARTITIEDNRPDTGDDARGERLQRALSLFVPRIKPRSERCRTCGRPVTSESPTFPFCSSRCRMADLGHWFDGRYGISRPIERDEELTD
jgi:tRNA threonylcarbamoyladenosine biosynthesis protein TsaE